MASPLTEELLAQLEPEADVEEWRGLLWPVKLPLHLRHLSLWKRWREPEFREADFLNPISEHFLEACRILWTPAQLAIHPWFEEMAEDYTNERGYIMWGAASCGKSHFMGAAALCDYMVEPLQTYIMLASTSLGALERRTLASLVDLLGALKVRKDMYVPLRYIRQSHSVIPVGLSEDQNSLKAIIKGVAVEAGSEKDAKNSVHGVHCPYVRIFADELAGMRPAIISVIPNMQVCMDFKFVGAANPEDVYDLCGVNSTPVGGYGTVSIDTKTWVTTKGWRVRRFDALDSPGIKEPEKYPFLPNARTNAAMIEEAHGDANHPSVWTYLRAFPPPQGKSSTVLTEAMVRAYNMCDEIPIWKAPPVAVAALDPAFVGDGDDAPLIIAKVGIDTNGRRIIHYDEVIYLNISATAEKPVTQQLADQALDACRNRGVQLVYLGCDDSATQSVADMIEVRAGKRGVYRARFNAKAPDLRVSVANEVLASVKYGDWVTWAWSLIPEYGQWLQIRGLPKRAAEQFCSRQVYKGKLEGKREYKKRTHGKSPDEADGCAILAAIVRERLGLLPGTSEWAPAGETLPIATSINSLNQEMVQRYNNLKTTYGVA